MKFFSIRKDIYQHNFLLQNQKSESFIGIKKPYTLIKSIYYVETASLFLYATHKIIKSPNLITFIYILFGLVGSFFIALNYSNALFYLGLFMVFTKGTFDWADGPLARRLNKTSFLGHALDIYGASIGDAAFRIAFVFYALSNYLDYMFLFPLFSFILLLPKFNTFADFLYLKNIENEQLCLKKKDNVSLLENFKKDEKNKSTLKLYNIYISFLDERARSIDSLLLILLFDASLDIDISFLLLILSLLIILRSIVKYFATLYFAFKIYKDK